MSRYKGQYTARTVVLSIAVVAVFCRDLENIQIDEIHLKNRRIRSGIPDNPDNNRINHAESAPLPSSIVPQSVTILSTRNLPSDKRFLPEVGNGHIATVVQSDTIFMNGLYSGANFSSHRARIPSTAGYTINAKLPSNLTRQYTLDFGRGVFTESYLSAAANITLRTYAHRLYTSTLVTELILTRSKGTSEVAAYVSLNSGGPSDDIDFTDQGDGIIHGQTIEAEYPDISSTTEFYMKVSPSLQGVIRLSPSNQTQTYLSLVVINVRKDIVVAEYDLAVKAFHEGTLLSDHVNEWNKIWNSGRIDMEGDISIAKLNYASLYYILSSLPSEEGHKDWSFIGLSPGGLAHGGKDQDYNGHVSWDQDLWMFSPIALLYPDLGRAIVETRIKTLISAKRKAQIAGWEGACYSWESAFTGLETSPDHEQAQYKVHINGDISLMVRQYWQLTRDVDLIINGSAAEIVWETAKFWCSRVTYDSNRNIYRILEVTPPDEWHSPVNDSAYTNNIAVINLEFANKLAKEFGKSENSTWREVETKLYYPFSSVLDYHPEFDGFNISNIIKQADVILLGFPLMVPMNTSTRIKDLTIYEKLTSIDAASPMTWAMFALGWLELENETKAADIFSRSILNAQQPFLVWSENVNGSGATNFITGMGGYLQSILFGYGGGRLHDNTMTFNPKLIPGTTKVKFTGVNYRGCSFDLEYSTTLMNLSLTSIKQGHRSLDVLFQERANWEQLVAGQDVQMKRQSFTIRSSE